MPASTTRMIAKLAGSAMKPASRGRLNGGSESDSESAQESGLLDSWIFGASGQLSGQDAIVGQSPPWERARVRVAPYEGALVKQRLHHLLDEERVALGALDYHPFERVELGAVTQQRGQHLPRAFPPSASSRNCV